MDTGLASITDFSINPEETTSPSQLEEVTLDPDASLTYSMGLRSPNGGPMRGRSVKEFEDQLKTLKKENFNLKLRIYFLEERMGTNFALDPENAVKKNIELMVEVESLRAELQEKQDLLCQAVKAMELEEEEHRKDSQEKEKELINVREMYENIQHQYEELQEEVKTQEKLGFLSTNRDQDIIRELDNKIIDLQNQLQCERLTVEKLNALNPELSDLQSKLEENDGKLEEAMIELKEKDQIISETNLKLESLEAELEEKNRVLKYNEADLRMKTNEVNEIQNDITNIKMLYNEAKSLYEQESKKNDKNKVAIANRNTKIRELEETVEEYKSKLVTVETKLQAAQNEVKSKPNDSWSPKSKRNSNDSNSFSVRGTASVAENSAKTSLSRNITPTNKSQNSSDNISPRKSSLSPEKKIEKLEQDQRKACHIIQTMIETKKQNTKKIEELHNSLQQRDTQIQKLEEKLKLLENKSRKSLQAKVSELNLTAAAPASDAEQSIQDNEEDPKLLLEQYRELIEKLDTQKQILYDTLKEKDAQMTTLLSKYEQALEELKMKDNKLIDLKFELEGGKQENNLKEKSDSGSEKVSFWIKESEDKDKEIEKLEKELAKRTNDLQQLVNKELWEKNREIEKLQRKFKEILDTKDNEIAALKKNISNQDNQLAKLVEKINDIETKEVVTKTILSDSKMLHDKIQYYTEDRKVLINKIDSLRKEIKEGKSQDLQYLQEELRKSEDLRLKSNEVCAKLTVRLEELAQYLASLLQKKSLLGFLGCDQNSKLQNFIDQTLELSRTLSLSITLNPDESLLQITNISKLLNDSLNISELLPVEQDDASRYSIVPEKVSLTYQSHLHVKNKDKIEEKEEIIKILRNQIQELKKQIELRDIELGNLQNANVHSKSFKHLDFSFNDKNKSDKSLSEKNALLNMNDSDSEAWSEPDRSVSKARIGLINDHSLKPLSKTQQSETSEIEGHHNRSLSRTPSKKSGTESKLTINSLMHQINELEEKLRFKELELSACKTSEQIAVRKYEEERANLKVTLEDLQEEKLKLQEAIAKHEALQETIKALEKNVFESAQKLKTADEELTKANLYVQELETSKLLLADSVDTKSKSIQNIINQLEVEKNQALQSNVELEKKCHDAFNEIKANEETIIKLKEELSSIEPKIKLELENKIKEVEQEYETKIHEIHVATEEEIGRLQEAATLIQNKYEIEYVKKCEVDRLVLIIQDLQDVLKMKESKLQEFEKNETEYERKYLETEGNYREKLNELRKEVDAATLEHTKLMLEKAKMHEEKSQMEIEIKQLYQKEEDFERQVKELKVDISKLKEKLQKDVEILELQKSQLNLKLSELESTNAQLMNKMLKLQSGQSNSAPTSPVSNILDMYYSRNRDIYNRQNSENSGSFGSESQIPNYLNTKHDYSPANVDLERFHSNSSPDLGIESDHGRFSSLEANVVVPNNRFLQSLEPLGLDKENSQLVACNNEVCSNRVTENLHLRKKLRTTTKLLEDTASHLLKANKRKKEVEKSICSQLQETHQLLKHVKVNFNSGSDSAITKK